MTTISLLRVPVLIAVCVVLTFGSASFGLGKKKVKSDPQSYAVNKKITQLERRAASPEELKAMTKSANPVEQAAATQLIKKMEIAQKAGEADNVAKNLVANIVDQSPATLEKLAKSNRTEVKEAAEKELAQRSKETPEQFNERKAAAKVKAAFFEDKATQTPETKKKLTAAQDALAKATAVREQVERTSVTKTETSQTTERASGRTTSKPLPMTPPERKALEEKKAASAKEVAAKIGKVRTSEPLSAKSQEAKARAKSLQLQGAEAARLKATTQDANSASEPHGPKTLSQTLKEARTQSSSAKRNLTGAKAALKTAINDDKKGKVVFNAQGEIAGNKHRIRAAEKAVAAAKIQKITIDQATKEARKSLISRRVATVKEAVKGAIGLGNKPKAPKTNTSARRGSTGH